MVRTFTRTRALAPGAALLGVALAGVVAAPAHAASLGLDQRCYVAGEKASVTGSGFAPRVPITFTSGATALPSATSDNSGAISQTLTVPGVAFGLNESQVEVVASDGVTSAHAYLNVTTAGASYSPAAGDPTTLRVSHTISGFGLSEVKPSIYLHYVSPTAQKAAPAKATTSTGGSSATPADPPGVKTIRLGQLRGPCGVLKTSPRRLFPFKAEAGQWVLQYDTRPRYLKGTSDSAFFWVTRKVTIKAD
ncbi:MAG: hypothetical protein AAGC46_00560 [Solirubrobacteraceae bacterium]|nr:hypothetical protein [Patulibacter sp.]